MGLMPDVEEEEEEDEVVIMVVCWIFTWLVINMLNNRMFATFLTPTSLLPSDILTRACSLLVVTSA